MTNLELQAIGIDADKWTAATEEQRVEWAKANTTALAGLCDKAKAWLKSMNQDVWMLDVMRPGSNSDANKYGVFYGYLTYRPRPDYQPPVKKWWFLPKAKDRREPHICQSETRPMYFTESEWLEVSADYAAYLQRKPDGECEIREVKKGDEYYAFATNTGWNIANVDFHATTTPNYRWCRPRKVAGWVVYSVVVNSVKQYYVCLPDGTMLNLCRAANLVGFGGVQFDGQDDERWRMGGAMLIEPTTGSLWLYSDLDNDRIPAVPVRARFWQEGGAK